MDKAKRWIDAHSMEVNAAVNVAIVGSVAFGSVFQIVEVDSDISAGWTIWEILRNIPRDNLDGVPAVGVRQPAAHESPDVRGGVHPRRLHVPAVAGQEDNDGGPQAVTALGRARGS